MPQQLEISPKDFSVAESDIPRPGYISAIIDDKDGHLVITLSEPRNGSEPRQIVIHVRTKEITFEWYDGKKTMTSCIIKEVWPTREHFFSKVMLVIGDFLGNHIFQVWLLTHPQFRK